jgi:hypothetical protein
MSQIVSCPVGRRSVEKNRQGRDEQEIKRHPILSIQPNYHTAWWSSASWQQDEIRQATMLKLSLIAAQVSRIRLLLGPAEISENFCYVRSLLFLKDSCTMEKRCRG